MTVFDYAMPNFEYSWGDKSNSASDSDYRERKNSEKYFILAGLFKRKKKRDPLLLHSFLLQPSSKSQQENICD
jgi:hypothetical protein